MAAKIFFLAAIFLFSFSFPQGAIFGAASTFVSAFEAEVNFSPYENESEKYYYRN